jgi:CheY-like chemotaxis protein
LRYRVAGEEAAWALVGGRDDRSLPRILIIDDEDDIRDAIAELLEAEGYNVVVARDGSEAIAHLAAGAHGVSLILLDLMMPNIDGWTFRRQQLADPSTAAIPVVIMSAAYDVRAAAASLAVSDFLVKPIKLSSLLNVVQRYCDG